ncbi:MAG TPA: pantoate--beta-alanine ligase [Phycisphaerales bacterium]|nr:pantoate--beta-alanine ligase [Phycisphaerales bacterium]HMP37797.1 pantoate--beta-alanine ligase [Phycisphaerales bacterium]
MRPTIVRDPAALDAFHGGAFVPTMGALHEGHAALLRRAATIAHASCRPDSPTAPVVLSIFVNPTQFAPGEDFDRYPRTFEADVALASGAGATAIFAPEVATIYPPDAAVAAPALPLVATDPGLEDAARPAHFAGVCQVVARLFDLIRPRWAIFGEKDYQQLQVIRAMVAAERPRWGDLEIVAQPTIRDDDGLAMSSRNRYLAPESRDAALALSRALQAAAAAQHPRTAEAIMRRMLEFHGLAVEYAVVRDAETLLPVESLERPTRALIAARLLSGGATVRLIDNQAMPVWC